MILIVFSTIEWPRRRRSLRALTYCEELVEASSGLRNIFARHSQTFLCTDTFVVHTWFGRMAFRSFSRWKLEADLLD